MIISCHNEQQGRWKQRGDFFLHMPMNFTVQNLSLNIITLTNKMSFKCQL